MKAITLNTEYLRKYPDPLKNDDDEIYSAIDHYILLAKAKGLPGDIPKDPNPRKQNTDKGIYKEIKNSLLDENDPTFHLKNKGITIIASRVDVSDDKRTVTVHFKENDGIVDGGHTYQLIQENQEGCPQNQYVKIEIITGIARELITSIAQGLNTGVQVQEMSLANLEGKFDWIKELLKGTHYEKDIAYKENEDGEYDIRELIALFTLFNIDGYKHESCHPKIAYTSKAKCLEDYQKNTDQYKKLEPLIKDILRLYDDVSFHGCLLYNKKYNGKGAKLAFYQTKKRGDYKYTFIKKTASYKLYDGALYPILGAFRYLVETDSKTNKYKWKVGSYENVRELFDQIGGDLINLTKNTSDSRGRNPNAIGKDDNHWDILYKTVKVQYLEQNSGNR